MSRIENARITIARLESVYGAFVDGPQMRANLDCVVADAENGDIHLSNEAIAMLIVIRAASPSTIAFTVGMLARSIRLSIRY